MGNGETSQERRETMNNFRTEKLISEDDLRVGLYYILTHPTGYVDALAVINDELPDYFREIGYISFGIDSQLHRRYRITDVGKDQARTLYVAMCRMKMKDELTKVAQPQE